MMWGTPLFLPAHQNNRTTMDVAWTIRWGLPPGDRTNDDPSAEAWSPWP